MHGPFAWATLASVNMSRKLGGGFREVVAPGKFALPLMREAPNNTGCCIGWEAAHSIQAGHVQYPGGRSVLMSCRNCASRALSGGLN